MSFLKLVSIFLIWCGSIGPSAHAEVLWEDLKGAVLVARLAIEGPFFVAELRISDTSLQYRYREATIDGVMPAPGCTGTFEIKKGFFEGLLDCSEIGSDEIIVQTVDLSKVTINDLKSSEGALIQITSSLMGGLKVPFQLFLQQEPYFNDLD